MFDRVNLWKILHSIYLFYEYLTQTVGYIPAWSPTICAPIIICPNSCPASV